MIKKTVNYLLLFIFFNLSFNTLWDNHISHDNDATFYECSNFKYNEDVFTENICFNCDKEESFLEHLFEKGVLIENNRVNSIAKIKNNFRSHFYLYIKAYKKYYILHKTYLSAEIDTPKEILILTLKNPRSPPYYS